ncbi:helix-turn-helix domain-containing protein [Glycomyces sp. TRM65418]|uniref:helix-turn-helix domain-containing protein n=1 Tax=Glycomyces sp. TRM65418 TaxID=2867006 RepID=UPI001CE641D7|nr:helix-turn-helix domain-containing protein [Glycomyces sp. TRM65418]MCC3763501.1 helix-turn-helix domain-containing protein [Glycomyces sp. TRM65418]QZD57485.1 helix-turn-helix domain-containing protein [Glycomyces sp. TRM65418]
MAHDHFGGVPGLDQRPSDSPYVERVYQVSEASVNGAPVPGRMVSVANSNWELIAWTAGGVTNVSVRGPETRPTTVPLGGGMERTLGVIFRHGAFLRNLPVRGLVDTSVASPHATARTFVLEGDEWEIPGYENAETFVDRLVRAGLLVRDPLVADVLAGDTPMLVTPRSVQRRVAAATGLTQGTIRQIERARRAAMLLRQGTAAADVVHQVGYHDQPHLARSLARFVGRRATQLQRPTGEEVLSLLYKTEAEVRP